VEDRQKVRQTIQEAIRFKKIFEQEYRICRIDGSLGWVYSRAIPILDRQGKIVEWFGCASDISRRKEAEQALLDASRHKDEFIATLAHELRNPLAPILNALEIMRLDPACEYQAKKIPTIIERQVAIMVRLIDDLLDISRISHGKIQLKKTPIELAKVIQTVIDTALPTIEAAEHRLEVNLPSYPIYVEADATRLEQVFANILNNAVKYTNKGGLIRLSVQQHDDSHVLISVLDNGIGIPPSMLTYIFDKFTQVDRSLERLQGGLGIGLSLVKELVELHHGTVEAISKGENRGSEFIVQLPLIFDAFKTMNSMDKSFYLANQYRILVVDDNIDITNSLATLLELMGHTTKTAFDGLNAIDTASSFQPDIILMDIGMPRLNGYDAVREIRKQFWGKHITLVALSGWGQKKDQQRALEVGFDFHLTKPADIGTLQELLHNINSKK
jgi:signal transduction histidine kinase/ActR/RegA family two-component response regulator